MPKPAGRHARARISRAPTAAISALAVAAPGLALAGSAHAAQAAPGAPQHHDTDGISSARLAAQARSLVTRIISRSAHRTVTVRSGDTLSGIAGTACGSPADWTGLARANEVRNPNEIAVGQVLTLACAPATLTAAQQAAMTPPARQAPVQAVPAAPVAAVAVSYAAGAYPGGSFGQCVVARESGGNAQVMNASGHYGLYQFSASTWAAYGGAPADFGHASAAEQERVFANALARGGQSNWSPYDGC